MHGVLIGIDIEFFFFFRSFIGFFGEEGIVFVIRKFPIKEINDFIKQQSISHIHCFFPLMLI